MFNIQVNHCWQKSGCKFMDIITQIISVFIIVFIVGGGAFAFTYFVYIPYKSERDYIDSEIYRTSGRERVYWERKRKNLYKKYIPLLNKSSKKK